MRADAETVKRWEGLVEEQRNSGLNVAAFCRGRDLPQAPFYWWRRRLRGAAGPAGGGDGFVEVVAAGAGGVAGSGVEIRVPAGVTIAVGRRFDREVLRQVLAAVRDAWS